MFFIWLYLSFLAGVFVGGGAVLALGAWVDAKEGVDIDADELEERLEQVGRRDRATYFTRAVERARKELKGKLQ